MAPEHAGGQVDYSENGGSGGVLDHADTVIWRDWDGIELH